MITFEELKSNLPYELPQNKAEKLAVLKLVLMHAKELRIIQGSARIEITLSQTLEYKLVHTYPKNGKGRSSGYTFTCNCSMDVLKHLTDVIGCIDKIRSANVVLCPYCGRETVIVENGNSGHEYRLECAPCDAFVCCHKDMNIPMGMPAKRGLRKDRMLLHRLMDEIWSDNSWERAELYDWLAGQMHKSRKETHVGCFNEADCQKATILVKNLFQEIRRPYVGKKFYSYSDVRAHDNFAPYIA